MWTSADMQSSAVGGGMRRAVAWTGEGTDEGARGCRDGGMREDRNMEVVLQSWTRLEGKW